jgi:hypothetical protein
MIYEKRSIIFNLQLPIAEVETDRDWKSKIANWHFSLRPRKTKRPSLNEAWDVRSNSPPPKSAHNNPNVLVGVCEWLQWAITKK